MTEGMTSNDTLFAQVIALGIAEWDASTRELRYCGMRHSLGLNNHGVPKINESRDLATALEVDVEGKLYGLKQRRSL